jgi:hypothetical protein
MVGLAAIRSVRHWHVKRFTTVFCMRIDLHQHLWPDSLVEALRRRTEPPCLDGDVVRVVHEKPFGLDLASQRVDADRGAGRGRDRRAVVSLSTPVGIEVLPAAEAAPLLPTPTTRGCRGRRRPGRWQAGALSPSRSMRTPGRARSRADPRRLRGRVRLPARRWPPTAGLTAAWRICWTRSPRPARRCSSILGLAPWTPPYGEEPDVVWWWRNLAVYPGLMLRAFFTGGWSARRGIRAAGGPRSYRRAPFLEERYRTFSGEPGEIDPNVFFDAATCRRNALDLAFATYGWIRSCSAPITVRSSPARSCCGRWRRWASPSRRRCSSATRRELWDGRKEDDDDRRQAG